MHRFRFMVTLTAAGCFFGSMLSAQPRTARAVAVQERIRIDGRLDEPSWRKAQPIGELIQVEPREGAPPTEKTEVRVLYDSDALYFGIICYDSSPSDIVATQMTRDGDLDVDDSLWIGLDPFFDQRNGFYFGINPAAARADGQISNNSEHPTLDWDGIWNAAARITAEGWEAEVAIPFKTLRFKPGQTTWGLNIERRIKRRNETDRWSGARRDIWPTNLAEAGILEGLPVIRQGHGLDIRPYGLVRKEGDDWKLDGGLDISKNLAPNVNASLTVNTDFAETDVDARQVNLTRFPLFYPEKRAFFLEGAGVFETAGFSPWSPDLLPFFSRRIGLYQGNEVPIAAGAKIAGRHARYNIGLLDVQTRRTKITTDEGETLELGSRNLLVARLSRDFWRQSYAGFIVTNGNPSGAGGNRLVGVDARLATSSFRGDKNLSLDLYLFRTRDDASRSSDLAGGFTVDYPNDRWDANFSWKQIGSDFRPALGFVPRTGIRKARGGFEFAPRPERWGIRKLTFEFRPTVITDLDNVIQNWSVRGSPLGIEFESGDEVQFTVSSDFERLDDAFEIYPGVVIGRGSYRWSHFEGEVQSASKRPWVVETRLGRGTFYSGTRRNYGLSLTLKPNHHLRFGFEGERNDIRLAQGSFFTQLLSVRADCSFSPDVSWTNLVQYDNESRILGVQSRFRWILKPGNDLFIVLNRGWYRTFAHDYLSGFDRATIKLQYTFRY